MGKSCTRQLVPRMYIFQEQDKADSPGGRSKGMVSYHKAYDRPGPTLLMGPARTWCLAGCTPFGSSYSLHPQHLRGPAAGSGAQLRSLRARWAAEQLDWFTLFWQRASKSCSPRFYLARMQIWADLSATCRTQQSVVPPRIFSAIMFRAACALAQRGTFGAAS